MSATRLSCPECGQALGAKAAGKRIRCPKCEAVVVPASAEGVRAAPSRKAGAAARGPRRSRREDEDRDEREDEDEEEDDELDDDDLDEEDDEDESEDDEGWDE